MRPRERVLAQEASRIRVVVACAQVVKTKGWVVLLAVEVILRGSRALRPGAASVSTEGGIEVVTDTRPAAVSKLPDRVQAIVQEVALVALIRPSG